MVEKEKTDLQRKQTSRNMFVHIHHIQDMI